MKTALIRILTVLCLASLVMLAQAQTPPGDTNGGPGQPPGGETMPPPPENGPTAEPGGPGGPGGPTTNGSDNGGSSGKTKTSTAIIGHSVPKAPVEDNTAAWMPPTNSVSTNVDQIVLNFHNAPLEMVLNYLSDAAGFIIVLDTSVHGNVSVISNQPMNRDEAVVLLNSVLNKNGLAAIRSGRTLTILDKSDAKTRDIPVKVSNDPSEIPNNDEIVTQVIPIRFVEADQLVKDLSAFVSPQATIVANEAGNSIVITDTQANIRHLAEIIKAIDTSAESETEIRVFRLQYANPSDVATLLSDLFQSSGTTGSNTQMPFRFGGPFGRFFGGNNANAGNNSQSDRIKKATQVIAVADARTSSLVVTASKDLMDQIGLMVTQLDVKSGRDQNVYVYHMSNGDPQQALQVLQSIFQSTSTTRGSSSGTSATLQNSALMQRQINNSSSSSSSVSASTAQGFGSSNSRGGGGTLP